MRQATRRTTTAPRPGIHPMPPACEVAAYGLRALPAWRYAEWSEPGEHGDRELLTPHPSMSDPRLLWSGKDAPPAIGSRVVANVNLLGGGEVIAYFREHGWLGVQVRLDNPPDWHRKQTRDSWTHGTALVFGAELL